MSISKQFAFHDECRNELFKGIKKMYDLVSATLGPHGRTILIEKIAHTLEPTKDGVTVANEVYSDKKWEDMGMQLVREASQKANMSAGDATTTAIVLSYHLCKQGLDLVSKRANVYQISKGIKYAVDIAVEHLKNISIAVSGEDDYKKVATVSTQDEEIGSIIAETFVKSGEHGTIDIERSDEPGIKSEKTDGLSFDKGWGSRSTFVNYLNDNKKKRAYNEDVPVLVVEKKIENENQLIPILEALAEPPPQHLSEEGMKEAIEERGGWPFGIRKLLVMCDDFSGSALGLMVANNKMTLPGGNGRAFHLMFTNAPSYGVHKIETMKDVCAVTGAEFISDEHGSKRIEYATIKDLGRAKKVIIEEEKTVIVSDDSDERKDAVKERIEFIKTYLEDMPDDNVEKNEWKIRLATLTDGISVLKVGAESENERHELKRRVEDGVRAVRSAREEGITPGCGVALLQCSEQVKRAMLLEDEGDKKKGMQIVYNALHAVTYRLLEVGFVEKFDAPIWKRISSTPEKQRYELVEEMKENMRTGKIRNCGYNFEKDCLGNMLELRVVDAKKAVRVALQSAASVATTFLKIDGAMGEINDEKEVLGKIGTMIAKNMRR